MSTTFGVRKEGVREKKKYQGEFLFGKSVILTIDTWRGTWRQQRWRRFEEFILKIAAYNQSRKLSVLVSKRTTCLQGGTTFLRVFLLFRHGVFNTKTFTLFATFSKVLRPFESELKLNSRRNRTAVGRRWRAIRDFKRSGEWDGETKPKRREEEEEEEVIWNGILRQRKHHGAAVWEYFFFYGLFLVLVCAIRNSLV